MTKRDDDAADLADRIAAVDDELYEIDERLNALAKGELSPSELAALSVEARERPSLDKAIHVMRPLDHTMRSRLLAAARETYFEGSLHAGTENHRPPPLRARSLGLSRTPGPRGGCATRALRDPPRRLPPAQLPRPRRRAWWKWAAPAAPVLVAALAMAWIRPGAPGRAESVPAYQVEWRSGELATRSGGTAPRARFTAGSALEIWMRVRTKVSRPVQAKVFVDGWDRPLQVDPDIAASGAVRLRGIVGEGPWTFETGSHELFLLVGPADAPLPELGPEGPGEPWHVSVLPFEVF